MQLSFNILAGVTSNGHQLAFLFVIIALKVALTKYSEFKEVMYYKENAISTKNTYNKPYIFWVASSLYFETWVSEKLLI